MNGKLFLMVRCVAVSILLVIPGTTFSADKEMVKDKTMEKLMLRSCIIDDTGLSEAEMSWYEPLVLKALKLNGGDSESVREMFRKAVGDGCVGDCLMERLRNWNRAMKREQIQTDAEDQVAARERKQEQTQDMSGDQIGDKNQTRTRDDEDCDPVGDANKNRKGDEAGDLTSAQAQDSISDQSGDQSQARTRDDEDCDPVGDANKNRKGD